jgi:preprotein translocase subunit SecG
MLTGFIIFCHAAVCLLLIAIVLVQSGRGGGLTENFAAAGEMFGAQTSSFLVKGTAILSTLFLVTCLGLALISARKSDSLMTGKVTPAAGQITPAVDQTPPAAGQSAADDAPPAAVETLGGSAADAGAGAESAGTVPAL